MNANSTPPTQADPLKPPINERTPVFSAASFHLVKPSVTTGLLLETGAWSTPVAVARQPENPAPRSSLPEEKSAGSTWRRHIGSARLTWSKLSSGELERIEGDPAKLSILLLRHYSFDRREADLQVKNFFHRNRV